MRLPIVDQFRQPFIEPLGYLVMFAAKADGELVRMICASRGEAVGANVVAHELRNWTAEAKGYVLAALSEIADGDLRQNAVALIDTFESLRDRRHRAVHDTWEVGIFGSEEDGYEVRPLRVGFVRQDKATTVESIVEVAASEIAALACEYEDLARDFGTVTYTLSR